MDYEKRHNELIEAIKVLRDNNPSDEGIRNWVNDNVPELGESKDERIREEITHFLKQNNGWNKEWFDWLEKQDTCNVDLSDCSEEYRKAYYDGYNKCNRDWLEKQGERNTTAPQWMIDFLNGYRRRIGCALDYDERREVDGKILAILDWLEKQGKQEPLSIDIESMVEAYKQRVVKQSNGMENSPLVNMCLTAFRRGIENALDELNLKDNTALEAIKEEKVDNENRVEPKFKVGDWVVYECRNGTVTLQIARIVEGTYEFTGSNLNIADEDTLHLYTIEDAKDGDVLAAYEVIVLFKKIEGYNIRCHFSYHYMNHQTTSTNELHNKAAFSPATKEQRNLLFQKMKEAGYEWDAELKELKKIERKPAE